MRRFRYPLDAIDTLALVGLAFLAVGVGLLVAPAAALVVIGGALLLYAVLASRAELA